MADRQKLLPFFDQKAIENTSLTYVGSGGISSEYAEGSARKGYGAISCYDHDLVEITNLNRQLFFVEDIGKKKGVCLAKNISRFATCGSVIEGWGYSFQDAVALGHPFDTDIVICGVDDSTTRVEVSRFFRAKNIPVIFTAVDYMAESGYVFVQEVGKSCFGCCFPDCLDNIKIPCRTPAVKDILKTVAGIGLYAIDSLVMERKRNWNFRLVHIAGFAPDAKMMIEKNPKCPLCGMK